MSTEATLLNDIPQMPVQVPLAPNRMRDVSGEALGMYTWLLSHKTGFKLSHRSIEWRFPKWGRDKRQKIVNELKQHGMLSIETVRENGQITGYQWVLMDPSRLTTENPTTGESCNREARGTLRIKTSKKDEDNKKGGERVAAPPPKKGSRLPEDFKIPADWVRQARESIDGATLLNLQTVADSFVDHWRAVAGSRGVKLDWKATWRNWVRKDAQTALEKQARQKAYAMSRPSYPAKPSQYDESLARPGESMEDFTRRMSQTRAPSGGLAALFGGE